MNGQKLYCLVGLLLISTAGLFSQVSLIPGVTQSLQAEDAVLSQAELESEHTGYTGDGYVNFINEAGGYIEWTVTATAAAAAECVFIFANGGAERQVEIRVNGTSVVASVIFPGTGAWTNWSSLNLTLNLPNGTSTIRMTGTGSEGGPNVDRLDITLGSSGSGAQTGDVNGDGQLDIVDALMTAQYYVGLAPAGFIPGNADINADGTITIVDALMMAQIYVGLIPPPATPVPTAIPTTPPTAPPAQEKTYAVTAVDDGLDNNDFYLMTDGLNSLGYQQLYSNTNVTTSAMLSYLQQDLTLFYHTGHGLEGLVETTDGQLYSYSTTINVENTIFATCLTLADTDWCNAFGQTAQCIMGYTDTSFDITDNEVVQDFVNGLAQNRSYATSWYLANSSQSLLNDRWAIYLREGSVINEYSARNGTAPKAADSGEFVALDLDNKLMATAALSGDQATPAASILPGYSLAPGELELAGGADIFSGLTGETTLTPGDALECAETYWERQGGLPEDAVLDKIIYITRAAATAETVVCGYVVLYTRQLDGLRIASNRIGSHLTCLVTTSGRVDASSRYWPELIHENGPVSKSGIMSIAEALAGSATAVAAMVKASTPLRLIAVEPVYGFRGLDSEKRSLGPAYALQTTEGTKIIVDAVTGELLQ